jgi:hypothetical protein
MSLIDPSFSLSAPDVINDIINIHKDMITIIFNTTINKFPNMEFVGPIVTIGNDNIAGTYVVVYNKSKIFGFSFRSYLNRSEVESDHSNFNFTIRNENFTNTQRFINKIENLILNIINKHNMLLDKFKLHKQTKNMADTIFLDNNIFIKIRLNKFELYFNSTNSEYADIDELLSNEKLLKYMKINFWKFCCTGFKVS